MIRIPRIDRPDRYEPRAMPRGGRGIHDLAALLKRIVRDHKREHRQPLSRVQRALQAIAPDLANCRIVGLKDGALEIGVPDAVQRAELAGFRRQELLDALQASPDGTGVAALRFRLIPREDS